MAGRELSQHNASDVRLSYTRKPNSRSQSVVFKALQSLKTGSLQLIDPVGDVYHFGNAAVKPAVTLRVHRPEFFSRLLSGGSLALGESYVDGWWDVEADRLVEFFKVLFRERLDRKAHMSLLTSFLVMIERMVSDPRSLSAARADIHKHYDLGNKFFRLMLGPTMAYSCGYMVEESDTLEQLQNQKHDRIIKKLGLAEGGTLLDIGCGWGSMLIRAAQASPNLQALGVTLSVEQQKYATERIAAEGLSDRVKVQLLDYRKLKGSFDYIVSVGMFEHVGHASYPLFMKNVHSLLAPDGIALLHTIGSEEDLRTPQDPWISKYIFPGSELPRFEQIASAMRKHDLIIGHVENLRPHYAQTLKLWRENVLANWSEIRKLGAQYDERFRRLWDYYLQFCQACFIDSTVELYQVLTCKREHWSFPMRFNF